MGGNRVSYWASPAVLVYPELGQVGNISLRHLGDKMVIISPFIRDETCTCTLYPRTQLFGNEVVLQNVGTGSLGLDRGGPRPKLMAAVVAKWYGVHVLDASST